METDISEPLNNVLLNQTFIMAKNNTVTYLDRLISCFNGVFDKEPRNITLREFLFDMSEQHKEQIMRLRACSSKQEQKHFKNSLPHATISGVFEGARKAENLAEHSGLICVDIDSKDNLEVPDFDLLIENVLSRFEEVLYAAHSVGGKGYFVIIPLKYPKLHKRQFLQLEEEFAGIGITIDHNCSDVCRLRCLSYDEAPYILMRTQSLTLESIKSPGSRNGSRGSETVSLTIPTSGCIRHAKRSSCGRST